MPPGDGSAEDDFPTRMQGAVFGYVRGQLLFSLIMGTSAGALLWVLGSLGIFPQGKTYAFAFGAFFGFAELIPYIGPAVGAFPPVMIALFSAEPLDALWLVIAFTALQQIEGHIVAPNVFGHALRINPLLVIFALLLGGQIYGFIGAFISLPIAAVLRETVVYLRRHLVLEPWPRAPAMALAGVGTEGGELPRVRGGRRAAARRAARPAGPSWATPTRPRPRRQPGRRDVAARPRRPDRGRRLQDLRRAPGAPGRVVRRRTAASGSRSSGPTAPARRRCCRSSPGSLRASGGSVVARAGHDRLGPAAAGALLEALRGREPAPVRAAGEARPTSPRRSSACSTRPGCATARTTRSAGSRAATASA